MAAFKQLNSAMTITRATDTYVTYQTNATYRNGRHECHGSTVIGYMYKCDSSRYRNPRFLHRVGVGVTQMTLVLQKSRFASKANS